MKKYLKIFLILTLIVFATKAEAFMLPPFKTDIAGTFQKYFTIVNTKVQTVKDKIKQATDLQSIIQKGKDAISEVKEYTAKVRNVIDKAKGFVNNISNVASKFSEINNRISAAKEAAGKQEFNISEVANSKISSIEQNIRELEGDILKNAGDEEKVAKNMQRIKALTQQKDQFRLESVNQLKDIKSKLTSSLSSLQGLKDQALDSLKSLSFDNLQILSKNYDSTENLKEVYSTLTPDKNTKITPSVMLAYKETYGKLWFADTVAVTNRFSTARSEVMDDNEDSGKLSEQIGTMEGGNSAKISAVVEGRKKNMQALITYTEMVLLKLKFEVAKDLKDGNFEPIDASAIEDFDFSNYRLTDDDLKDPEVEYEEETPPSPEPQGETLQNSIESESAKAIRDSLENIANYSTRTGQGE